ncbi:MAG TPA: S-adenosylmethionine:tRNA ribosyltransferase-isomerase [Polyangiaceae bacterium]|nr:S-adenosylmethionine:tRNA ribosyltransferase-isomerase [Polyangiaceae bacterium]
MATLTAARWPREDSLAERLLLIEPDLGGLTDRRIADLPALLTPADLLIVNDAATLPASLHTSDGVHELRLLGRLTDDTRWRAVVFGGGDWRSPTEQRPEPLPLAAGARLNFTPELSASVEHIDRDDPRLIEIRFDRSGAEFWAALYRLGKPVQYAYLAAPLELWHVQSHFASRPWAVELASAGRPLSFGLLFELRRRGIEIGSVTHAAGLSSTGSERLDRRLPMAERYAIPEGTCELVRATRQRGGRVIAVGTTVVRALEASAAANGGTLEAGEGEARLLLGPGFEPLVVDGVLTGMHERGTSHFALLEAFAPRSLLEAAIDHAAAIGYVQHEFGDSCLILPTLAK